MVRTLWLIISVEIMELNYNSFGQGDAIVILHGLFGALDNWQTIAKQLAEQYTVYIVDHRTYGRSPHRDEMNYRLMAEDLKEFMESHWMYKAHIVGHSMGGKTAMQFALEYPDMVDKLVVIDIAPKKYEDGHTDIFEALMGLDLEKMESRDEADDLLRKSIKDYGVRQFLLKNLSRSRNGGFQWKLNLPVIYDHYPDILAATTGDRPFEGRALFVKGSLSPYIQPEDEAKILELFPNARIETVTNAGHWVHAEAPAALLALLLRCFDM